MKSGRVNAVVLGCLLLLPGIGLLIGGAGLGLAYAFARDGDGYFTATIDRLDSSTAAVTAEDLDLTVDPGSPDWLLDRLDADVRLQVTGGATVEPLFVGIGRAELADQWFARLDAPHKQLTVADTSGHRPLWEQPAQFHDFMTQTVLALTQPTALAGR